MHYAEGSLMALMVTNLIFSCKQSCPSHLTYLTY
jgi:hypothetical protein